MITLEEVLSPRNMLQACDRVITNKGAPGVDGMTVDQCSGHFAKHGASICAHIRQGTYIPFPVRRVDIPTCKSSKDHSKPRNEVDTSLKSPV